MRFLRIHPVQSVIDNPTQLSGRGVPHILYVKLCLSRPYVFSCSQMEAESRETTEILKHMIYEALKTDFFGNRESYNIAAALKGRLIGS